MKQVKYYVFLFAFYFLQLHFLQAKSNDLLLEEVISGHKATKQAIVTFSAEIVAETELPVKGVLRKGKYWRFKETARIREFLPSNAFLDYLISPTDIRIVARGDWIDGEPTRIYARRLSGNESSSWCDVWSEMGLNMRLPSGETCSYETMVARAKKVQPARRVTYENRPCIQVILHEATDNNSEIISTLTHDIGYNYMIVNLTISYSASIKQTINFSNFKNFKNGIFFPLESTQEAESDGKISARRMNFLSQVSINEPLLNESLALPEIPDGTPLEDRVAGITGIIDSNWNWIEQTGKTQPPTVLPPQAVNAPGGPSEEEPTSFWSWVLLFGGGFFAVTGAILIYLKSRQ